MPFKNIRQRRAVMAQLRNKNSRLNKFKRCEQEVEAKGDKRYNPYAVCRASTGYKGTTRNIGLKHRVEYRIEKKKKY